MKKLTTLAILFAFSASTSSFAGDWPSTGGNAQRDGWSRGEQNLSKESAAKIQFLYSFPVQNGPKGADELTSPTVLGNIITYKGFKHLVFFGGTSNAVYGVDADLGKLFFATPLEHNRASAKGTACSDAMTANVAFAGNSLAPGRFGLPGANHTGRVARNKNSQPHGHFSMSQPVYAVTGDGYLHYVLQLSGHANTEEPKKFLPADAHATGLNVDAGRIFAGTTGACNSSANGIYSIDPDQGAVNSFLTGGSGPAGDGGTSIGTDGVVYAQITSGHNDAAGDLNGAVVSLDPETLKLNDYFTPSGAAAEKSAGEGPGTTPLIFGTKEGNKDWVVSGGADGRIYILDADSLGGADHHTPAYRSDVVVNPGAAGSGNGIWHSFATSTDSDGTRWLYAAVHGASAIDFPTKNGDAAAGSILAFKVVFHDGAPTLVPVWSSREMLAPAAPAVANGLVFALSTGQPARTAKENGKPYSKAEREKLSKPARLYVLDGATGKELYVGDKATTFATGGLAVANSQIYFTTHDNALQAYGIPLER
ncbi:MAG TPA: hypothetical protein VL346_13025 [Acidobacteriaceae bacterium]|nr:hypothetical protein [Acidobacteriaceae bacterium]